MAHQPAVVWLDTHGVGMRVLIKHEFWWLARTMSSCRRRGVYQVDHMLLWLLKHFHG